jgi:predicted aspartyl protease
MKRQGDNEMGRVAVEVDMANGEDVVLAKTGNLAPDKVRRIRAAGVVDTAASHLVLPKHVATQLGVPVAGKAIVRYADHRRSTRQVVENVQVELLGRHGLFKAIVEPRRDDVLIGVIVLEDLDLLVDPRGQQLRPRDPENIIAEIE